MAIVKKEKIRSQSLDLLRFPLAVVVLTVHVFSISRGITLQGVFIETYKSSLLMEVATVVNAFLRGQSVPIYFFISGFVFYLGLEPQVALYKRKFKNRTKSLLIPYILWNLIAALLVIVKMLPCFKGYLSYTDTELNLTLPNFLSCFWMYNGQLSLIPSGTNMAINASSSIFPINTPLWFIRDLILIVLFTPVIYKVIKSIGYYWIIGLGTLWFIGNIYYRGFGIELITALFFFSWGAYMSINKKDMIVEFGQFFKGTMIMYPLLGGIYILLTHWYPAAIGWIKQLNIIVGLFFAYNLASWLLSNNICKVNKFLASASFFIYISHMLICDRIVKILYLMIKPNDDWSLLSVYVMTVIVSVAILLIVYYLMNRYTPSLLTILAGRKAK